MFYRCFYCNYLRDFVQSLQFKKREKQPWKSVTLACNFTKISTPSWTFFTFFELYK